MARTRPDTRAVARLGEPALPSCPVRRLILETAGSSMANVLKVHMTVSDPNRNLPLVNEGYRGHFPDPPPARSYSGCGVDEQGRDHVLIQIDCVAYVD